MGKIEDGQVVRLASKADYPAERLIELSTRVQTGDDFSDCFDIADMVLGEDVPQGSLLAYLLRRFGYPNRGSDPDKELATYMLTTMHPGMLLRISPYAGGDPSISFRFQVPYEVDDECSGWETRDRDAHNAAFADWIEREERIPAWAQNIPQELKNELIFIPAEVDGWRRILIGAAMMSYFGVRDGDSPEKAEVIRWYISTRADYESANPQPSMRWRCANIASWDNDDPMKPYALAMVETLGDLRRQVWIRDRAIGIYGPIEEDDPDAPGHDLDPAPKADVAGFPSGSLGNHDPRGLADLHSAILRLDPDPSKAMAIALTMLTEGKAEADDAQ